MPRRVCVFAPATISNLGPGFDVLGLALERPGDVVEVESAERAGVELVAVTGDEGVLSRDPAKNAASVAAAAVLRAVAERSHLARPADESGGSSGGVAAEGASGGLGAGAARAAERGRAAGARERTWPPGVRLWLQKQMPLASGLGSSGASSAAGAVAVNALLGAPLTPAELICCAMEGERATCGSAHADNVAPSILGGIVLVRSYDPLEVVSLPVPPALRLAVVRPHTAVATRAARSLVVDRQFALADVVSNLGQLGAFVTALHRGDLALLGRSVTDRLVEPVRAALIPGFAVVKAAALAAGALGCSIAGSGPAVFAFCDDDERAARVAAAMQEAFRAAANLGSDAFVGPVNLRGAQVIEQGD